MFKLQKSLKLTFILICILHSFVFSLVNAGIEKNKNDFSLIARIYIDNRNKFTIKNVEPIPFNAAYKTNLNLGFTTATLWIKNDIKNNSNEHQAYYFEIKNPYLEDVQILVSTNKSSADYYHLGCLYNKIQPVKILLLPGETGSIYCRIRSGSPLRVPISVSNIGDYNQTTEFSIFYKGIFQGIFWLVFLIAIYVTFLHRSKVYLFFALSSLFTIIYIMGQDNLLPVISSFIQPDILLRISNASVPLLAFSYIAFSQTFFEVKEQRILKLFYVLYFYSFLHLLIYFFNYYLATRISFITIPVVIIVLIIVSFYLYFKLKKNFIKLYLFATLALLAGVILHVLSSLGILPNMYLAAFSFKTGFLTQLLVYLIAISERLLLLQKDFTIMLESKVTERTREVDMANEELKSVNEQLIDYQQNLENTVLQRTEELRKLNASLNLLIQECPMAIFDVDSKVNVLSVWNPAAERIFGWTAREVVGKSIPYIAMDTRLEYEQIVEELKKGKSVTNIELKRKNKRGGDVYTRATLIPIQGANDTVERILVFVDDITDRQKMMDAILESESKFRTLFLSSRMGIMVYTPDQIIMDLNPAFREMTGFSFEDTILRSVFDFVPDIYHKKYIQRIQKLLNGEKLAYWEFEFIRKDNTLFSVEAFDTLIELGGRQLFMTVLIDITDQKNYQQKIFESILQTEENERKRFAGDLHDELGPQLASMRIYASSLKKRTKDPEMLEIVDELMENIKNSITNVREISNNLSPHLLENYGLAVAIRSDIENRKNFFQVNFEQNIEDRRFENKIETVFYRICKELLNNTVKYAKASLVEISVIFENNYLNLIYTDNGIGFDYTDLLEKGSTGLGLLNIQSRIQSIQGNCIIQSYPGEGFKLKAKVFINS